MNTPPEVPHPLDDTLKHLLMGIQQWQSENTPEKLQREVKAQLDAHRETIVMKLLGFNTDSFGRGTHWELDHCNGRQGESAAGTYLRNVQAAAIKSWLETIELPDFPATVRKSIEKTALTEYKRCFQDAVWKLARSQAEVDAKALIAEITKTHRLETFQKTLQLIGVEPSNDVPERANPTT